MLERERPGKLVEDAKIRTLEDTPSDGEGTPSLEQGDQGMTPHFQSLRPDLSAISADESPVRVMTTEDQPLLAPVTMQVTNTLISSLPSPAQKSLSKPPSMHFEPSMQESTATIVAPVKACLLSATEVPTEPLSSATPVLEYTAEDSASKRQGTALDQAAPDDDRSHQSEASRTMDEAPTKTVRIKPEVEGRFEVKFAYTRPPDDNTQLSVKPGDVVLVQRRDPSGWTYGRREPGPHDRRIAAGWFPDALLGDEVSETGTSRKMPTTPRSGKVESGNPEPSENQTSFSSPRWSKGHADELKQRIAATEAVIANSSSTAIRRPTGRDSPTPNPTRPISPGEEEEAQLLICEKRLANRACVRRKCLDDCHNSETRVKDAEREVEEAERILKSLESQERRCLTEVNCTMGRQRQHTDIKLKALTEKREAAALRLQADKCRLQEDRRLADAARQRLRAEQAAAKDALLAVSKQREKAKAAALGLTRRTPSAPRCATAPRDNRLSLDAALDPKAFGGLERPTVSSKSRLATSGRMSPTSGRMSPTPGSQLGHTTWGGGRMGSVSTGPASQGNLSARASRRSAGSPELRIGSSVTRGRSSTGGAVRVRSPAQKRPVHVSPVRKVEGAATTPVPQTASELADLPQGKQHTVCTPRDSAEKLVGGQENAELNGSNEEELAQALDLLRTAETLRSKLEAVPPHLRQPLMERFSDLRGLLQEPAEAG